MLRLPVPFAGQGSQTQFSSIDRDSLHPIQGHPYPGASVYMPPLGQGNPRGNARQISIFFGSRLEALVRYLSGAYRFSKRKIVSLWEFFGIPMSLGVCKLQSRATKALEPGMVEIDNKIMEAFISLNVDETGIRFKGKLAYIWVAVCRWEVKYLIGPRSRLSFDRLVRKPLGVISSDRFPVYIFWK